jgi:hypothetical protein
LEDPHKDIPENYLTVTCELKEQGVNGSHLEFTQGDYAKVADGERRYKDFSGGGDAILQGIKKLAEAQGK